MIPPRFAYRARWTGPRSGLWALLAAVAVAALLCAAGAWLLLSPASPLHAARRGAAAERQIRDALALPVSARSSGSAGGALSCPSGARYASDFNNRLEADWSVRGNADALRRIESRLRLVGSEATPTVGPALRSRWTVPRQAGAAVVTVLRPTVTRAGTTVALAPAGLTDPADSWGWYSGQLSRPEVAPTRVEPGAGGINYWAAFARDRENGYATGADNVDTLLIDVLRPSGHFSLLATSHARGEAELVRVAGGAGGAARPLHVEIDAGGSIADLKAVCVVQTALLDSAVALASDDFARPDAPSLERPAKGPAWSSEGGAWRISARQAVCDAPGVAILPDLAEPGGTFEVTLGGPGGAPLDAGLVFGYRDQRNYWVWRAAGDRLSLDEVADGRRNIRFETGAAALADERPHRIAARVHGGGVQLWLDDTNVAGSRTPPTGIAVAGAGARAGAGLYCGVAGARFADFAAWPAKVTLPSELRGLLPLAPARDGAPLVQDSLAGPVGPLQARRAAGSLQWAVLAGQWGVGPQGLIGSAPGVAVLSLPQRDAAAEVTVQLPASDVPLSLAAGRDSFPGITLRASGAGSRIWGRFLWQDASPEIEIWQAVGGAGRLVGAVNISNRFALGQDHRLRLAVVGNEVAAWLDDRLVLQATLEDASPGAAPSGAGGAPGAVGLSVDAAGSPRFRDFAVWRARFVG